MSYVIPLVFSYFLVSIVTILLYNKEMVSNHLDTPIQFTVHFLGWPIYLPWVFYHVKRVKK